MSQCGPSLWPLDHSVISSPYTLLMVRTCCTLCEWRVPCRVRMIECWRGTHRSHSFVFFSTLCPSVPSVPQGVSALSTGPTTVSVTWMEPAVYFRECIHDYSTILSCIDGNLQYILQSVISVKIDSERNIVCLQSCIIALDNVAQWVLVWMDYIQ